MTELAKMKDAGDVVAAVDPMVSMIERVALDPDASIEKLERMLEMKERLESKEAVRAFNDAFARCQREIPTVLRNRRNQQTNSNYADLAAVESAVMPTVNSHGFSMRFFPTASPLENHYGVDCVVSHEGGHSETHHADVPSDGKGLKGNDNKTATHAFGSTMSYGRRYLLCMIWNIATADNDGNGSNAQKSITADQFVELQRLIDESGADKEKFLLAYRAESLEEFPLSSLTHAKQMLEKKAAAK